MAEVQVRDIQLYYEVHGNPDGEPLVLLHGFTGAGIETFHHLIDQLGERYQLFIPDLRGHGRSTNPGGKISHLEFSRDTVAFTQAMGLDQVHFCGHSSGGMHLLFVAISHPELIQSLTLVSSTYTFDEHLQSMAKEVRASASDEWIEDLRAIHGETHGDGYADTILDLWLESVLRPGELPFTLQDLGGISSPTMILHGDRDPFFPVSVPVRMYEAIPNAELCILPNCGHGLPVEQPTLFGRVLLEFLSRYSYQALE